MVKQMKMSIRENYAEGRFYGSTASAITRVFDDAVAAERPSICYSLKDKVIWGGVVPHAGHVYCAREAVHFFEIVKASGVLFDTVVLINPNHTGYGDAVSIDSHSHWKTPLGVVEVDMELANLMNVPISAAAQRLEHSAEVVLPFIQHFLGDTIRLLPINMRDQSYRSATNLAAELRLAVTSLQRKVLVIASSDFNHFKRPQVGYELDSYALEALLKFDLQEFERRVKDKKVSICGYGAIMALLQYAMLVDEQPKVDVLRRGHSGEVFRSDEVVDYVSLLVYSE